LNHEKVSAKKVFKSSNRKTTLREKTKKHLLAERERPGFTPLAEGVDSAVVWTHGEKNLATSERSRHRAVDESDHSGSWGGGGVRSVKDSRLFTLEGMGVPNGSRSYALENSNKMSGELLWGRSKTCRGID